METLRIIWCVLMHYKFHEPVPGGKIDYYRVMAFYDTECQKCGIRHRAAFRWKGPRI